MATGIDIYRGNDVIVGDLPITESAVHKATLMKEDYVKLVFSDVVDWQFKAGDKIKYNGIDYSLAVDYVPSLSDEETYSYELQFNAPWYNLDTYMFLFLTETFKDNVAYVTRRESEWEFTGTAEELLSLIIKNTRQVELYDDDFAIVGTRSCPCAFDAIFYCEPTEVKSFSFSSTDIISALNQISKEYELEWWVEVISGKFRLHFGECDNSIIYKDDNTTQFNSDGTRAKDVTRRINLTMGENISKPTIRLNEELKRYYYVYGSSRNIDQTITSLDVNALATKRLSLDNPIDKGIGSGEEVVIFDDVYPKNDYQVTKVNAFETESETIVGYDKDGNPIYDTYYIYQVYSKEFSDMVFELIKNDENVQNIEDIVASGKKLSIKFITKDTGTTTITPLLAGWEFEVAAVLESDKQGNEWYELQLIHQDLNGYIIPNKNLCPRGAENGVSTDLKGNTTVIEGIANADWICIYNIKAAYIDRNTMNNAKQELSSEFEKYYANKKKNITYTVSPYVDQDINLKIGDAIKLTYGGQEVITRVNGFTKHLDFVIDASYELCSYTNQGVVNSLKDEVKVLNIAVNRIGNTGTDANAVVDLINEYGKKHFLSKDAPDTAAEPITFSKGAFTDLLRSMGYIPDFGGSGFSLEMKDGKSFLTVDNAYIRNKATFDTLEIRKVTHTGGVEIKSPASCEIASVGLYYPYVNLISSNDKTITTNTDAEIVVLSKTANAYKCYFKATDGNKTVTNDWQTGDLAICHEYNLTTGSRYYWRKVIDVSTEPENGFHWVALSYTDCDGDDAPMQGDTIVCLGSSVKERQNAIVLAANGNNAPSFAQLRNISTYNITNSNVVTLLSPSKNIIRGNEIYLEASGEDKSVGNLINENTAAIGDLGSALDENTNAITSLGNQVGNNADAIRNNTATIEKHSAMLSVHEDQIGSVVKKTSQAYDFYSFSDFSYGEVLVYNDTVDCPLGVSTDDSYINLCIKSAKKGDRIHIELETMFATIFTCDNNASDAYQYMYDEHFEDIDQYSWKGFCRLIDDTPINGEYNVYDFVLNEDADNVYIFITDDSGHNWNEVTVSHVKAAVSSESRITQTADEITAKVGKCGIDIDSSTITLDAERTIVKGNLDIQKVSCYYKDANGNDDKTKPMSEYNGSGNGTLVYYYPNGKKMREDVFKYDENGNVVGLWTIYYKTDGTIAWQLTETGFLQTLEEFWSDLGTLHYTTSPLATLKTQLKQYAQTDTNIIGRFTTDNFSMYNAPTDTSKYKQYNNKIAKGKMYKQTPDTVTLFNGILIYDISIVSQRNGIVHYEAVIMEVSSALGQLSTQTSYKFNSLGGDD